MAEDEVTESNIAPTPKVSPEEGVSPEEVSSQEVSPGVSPDMSEGVSSTETVSTNDALINETYETEMKKAEEQLSVDWEDALER